jgi:amino acid adenylation domain-containing protein
MLQHNNVSIDKALALAVENWPDRPAFRFSGGVLSYADLGTEAQLMAKRLSANGVAHGDRVALAMHKGLEMAVAIHAIWLIGAAFVPLDPSAPISRLSAIVEECGISVVIGAERNAELLKRIADATKATVLIAEVGAASQRSATDEPEGLEPHENKPDDLAYIIFTSGSTGVPKGICHTFASGTAFAHAWMKQYQLSRDDVFFSTVPLHFDFSLADFFTPAMVGAMTELVPEQALLFPASLSNLLEESGGTIWSSVPYTFVQLCERGAVENHDFSALRWLIYGGEPMPPSSLPRLRQVFRAQISNSYGPAEVNQVSEFTVPDDHPPDVPIPIGHCMGKAIFEIAGDGELLVASPSMMRGYWNRPDLTEASFEDREGTRFYRTGDRVAKNDDGLWVFLGREDRQAKVRGYRIELDEIEMAMASYDGVSEAAAVVSADSQRISGFVTPAPGQTPDMSGLKSFLSEKLPRYMVPDDLEVCASFVKTSTGKINRRALKGERN